MNAPQRYLCEACKGNGEVYLKIAGDVHIAKCEACEGWGTVETLKKPKKIESFGKVDIDALLKE